MLTFGSVCSGIEAATVAWRPLGLVPVWYSETAQFPSAVLARRWPKTPNVGDARGIAAAVEDGRLPAPDIVCGGTPCQAFSFAGARGGLADARGNLTLAFADVIATCDCVRKRRGLPPTMAFWENVEGALCDTTNAFGCLVFALAGMDTAALPPDGRRWPTAGSIIGPERTVAWRTLNARGFGLPQQRRRVYVVSGGPAVDPATMLFENALCEDACRANATRYGMSTGQGPTEDSFGSMQELDARELRLILEKDGHTFEVFRTYTDCLCTTYGRAWNGNASAYNGSLFVVQDGRLRRLSVLECERLMGFPEGYTDGCGGSPTARYMALGNSWAVAVVRWLGQRIAGRLSGNTKADAALPTEAYAAIPGHSGFRMVSLSRVIFGLCCGEMPLHPATASVLDILSSDVPENLYLSAEGRAGILRRGKQRRIAMPARFVAYLQA